MGKGITVGLSKQTKRKHNSETDFMGKEKKKHKIKIAMLGKAMCQ